MAALRLSSLDVLEVGTEVAADEHHVFICAEVGQFSQDGNQLEIGQGSLSCMEASLSLRSNIDATLFRASHQLGRKGSIRDSLGAEDPQILLIQDLTVFRASAKKGFAFVQPAQMDVALISRPASAEASSAARRKSAPTLALPSATMSGKPIAGMEKYRLLEKRLELAAISALELAREGVDGRRLQKSFFVLGLEAEDYSADDLPALAAMLHGLHALHGCYFTQIVVTLKGASSDFLGRLEATLANCRLSNSKDSALQDLSGIRSTSLLHSDCPKDTEERANLIEILEQELRPCVRNPQELLSSGRLSGGFAQALPERSNKVLHMLSDSRRARRTRCRSEGGLCRGTTRELPLLEKCLAGLRLAGIVT